MLKDKIQSNSKEAMKGKKELEVSVLRMVLATIASKETEKRTKIWKEKPQSSPEELGKESQLTDEEVVEVVSSEIKKRRDAILLYEKGGRQELADKEKKEMEILSQYLPEQLSEEEIKKLVQEVIVKTGAKEIKEMGKVMAELASKIKGKAEGSVVSKIVKELLS